MAKKVNIIIDQGSVFLKNYPTLRHANGQIFNLSGYQAFFKMKKSFENNQSLYSTYTATPSVDSNTGVVSLQLGSIETSAWNDGNYNYDINIINTNGGINTKMRIFEGTAVVRPSVDGVVLGPIPG